MVLPNRNRYFYFVMYGQPGRARRPLRAYLHQPKAAPLGSGKGRKIARSARVVVATVRHHAAGVATAHPQEGGCTARQDPGVGQASASRVPQRRASGDGRGGPEMVVRPQLQWLALCLLRRGGEGVGGARIPQVRPAIRFNTASLDRQERARALARRRGTRAVPRRLPNSSFSRSTARSPPPALTVTPERPAVPSQELKDIRDIRRRPHGMPTLLRHRSGRPRGVRVHLRRGGTRQHQRRVQAPGVLPRRHHPVLHRQRTRDSPIAVRGVHHAHLPVVQEPPGEQLPIVRLSHPVVDVQRVHHAPRGFSHVAQGTRLVLRRRGE